MYTHKQTQEIYRDLRGMIGKADFVSEEAIRNSVGDQGFEALKQYNFIEYGGEIQGKNIYIIPNVSPIRKYEVMVGQVTFGKITIEAKTREEAKAKALDEGNRNQIKWYDSDKPYIVEVTRLD